MYILEVAKRVDLKIYYEKNFQKKINYVTWNVN